MNINISDFPESIQKDPIFGDMISESIDLINRCHEYIISKMPAMTFSHTKARLELGDELESDATQKISELQVARHLRYRKFCLNYKTEVENAIDDHGKNRYFCESNVEGCPIIADHRVVLGCIDTLISTLERHTWTIKNIKDRTNSMFEKTK